MSTRELSVSAVLTAALTGGKLALSFLPNIEIVTLLFIVYALTFGWRRTMIICLVFVLLECFIWGFGWWMPIYLIYWPLMVSVISLLPKFKFRIPAAVISGIALTAFFGVLSTAVEIGMLGGLGASFWQYFYYRYISGIPFFVTHIISNAVILPLLVPVLYKTFKHYQDRHQKTVRPGKIKAGKNDVETK